MDLKQIRVSYCVVGLGTGKPGPIQTKLVDVRCSGWNIKHLWLGFLPEDKYQEQPSQSSVQHGLTACHRLMSEPMSNLSPQEVILSHALATRCGRWQAQTDMQQFVVKTSEEVRLIFGLLYQAWNFGREFKAYVELDPNMVTTELYRTFDRQKFRLDARLQWFLFGYQEAVDGLFCRRATSAD